MDKSNEIWKNQVVNKTCMCNITVNHNTTESETTKVHHTVPEQTDLTSLPCINYKLEDGQRIETFFCINSPISSYTNGTSEYKALTLNAPIATKVVCFSRLLKYLRSLYGKQCGPRSDCS